jgi:chaperone modulatory protein CbpM
MNQKTLTGILLDEQAEWSLEELSRACVSSTEWVVELVEEGVLDPIGHERALWRFSGVSLQRARAAARLQNDLNIDLAGVALALDLMDEIQTLHERLCRLETNIRP